MVRWRWWLLWEGSERGRKVWRLGGGVLRGCLMEWGSWGLYEEVKGLLELKRLGGGGVGGGMREMRLGM